MYLSRSDPDQQTILDQMFADRKTVFVDTLKWTVPVLDGKYEIDEFDLPETRYVVIVDGARRHLASARILPTTGPHLLRSIFPQLCCGPIPIGRSTAEITRFCLSPDIPSQHRRQVRNRLVTALAEYALEHAIETFTGVAEHRWFTQIARFGWTCSSLADQAQAHTRSLVAFRIDIGHDTLRKLEATGIHTADQTYNSIPVREAV